MDTNFQAPVAVAGFPAAIPAPVAAIPSGDAQAAAIDAKVQLEDLVRAAADKARELNEQAVEQWNEKLRSGVDAGQEQVA